MRAVKLNSTFDVKLEQFEGPLDLLLHLIKVNEIDIFAVDLRVLVQQYFSFLQLVNFRDLAAAGDFLQIAAALIEIKSRRLIPREQPHTDEETQDLTDTDDPQQELKQRLLVYYSIKQAAVYLQGRYLRDFNYGNEEWARLSVQPSFQERTIRRGDRWMLPILYEQLLAAVAVRRERVPQAKLQKIKIEIIMAKLLEKLEEVGFTAFQEFYPQISSRFELAVYFIAALELARSGQLLLHQAEVGGALWLYLPSVKEREDWLPQA